MQPKLSILIPSCRPEGLKDLLASLRYNSAFYHSLQIIILVDDENIQDEFVAIQNNELTIHIPKKPENAGNVGMMLGKCLELVKAPWVLFANDDVVCETKDWDQQLYKVIDGFTDDLWLLGLNDKMFQGQLFCFPIIAKRVLDLIEVFPTRYKRYKIDDTIFNAFPMQRRGFLENIVFRHKNFATKDTVPAGQVAGAELGDGRVYVVDAELAKHDEMVWSQEYASREKARTTIRQLVPAIEAKESKVMIAIPTAEMARRADFYDYYNIMVKPAGTVATFVHGQSPARNRNVAIQQAFDANCTHILFIDDDVTFDKDILERLLKHDKDVVTALYLMRNYPHKPIVFDWADENGLSKTFYPKDGEQGLIEIVSSGLGMCLIKMEVFRKLASPWIRLGEYETDQWCDDIGFFKRVKDAGFKCYCDLTAIVGHMAQCTIYPAYVDGKWYVRYDTAGPGNVAFPMVRPPLEVSKEEKSA